MKKILYSTLLALVLIVSMAIPVSAGTGLGISPASLDITLDEGESGIWEFYAYYFSGTVNVEAVGIPISVSPNSFDVLSSPSALPITLTNISPIAGVYTGYLRFTGLSANNTGLAIQVDVSVLVTATVAAPASGGGGGGGGGGGIDKTPPTISKVSLCSNEVTETTADICWQTNERSTSQVEYWSSPSEFSVLSETYNVYHHVQLTDLTPDTTYYYKTMSVDKLDNLAISDEHTFTTLGAVEPVIPESTPLEPELPVTPEPVAPEPIEPTTPVEPIIEPEGVPVWLWLSVGFGSLLVIAGIAIFYSRLRRREHIPN